MRPGGSSWFDFARGQPEPRSARLAAEHEAIAAVVQSRLSARRGFDSAKVDGYLKELRGDFSVPVHRVLRALVEPALGAAFTPPRAGLDFLAASRRRIPADGPLELLRELARRATLIYAPTHSSSFDTLVLALTLAREGLPPGVYPADQHMFRNRLIALGLRHLGSYRIDRACADRVYWQVVMEYSTVLLERGFHSVIFPAGTRNRSNVVDSELKGGLLRTGLRAQNGGAAERPIYVVPVTLNHLVVFEAEWLIAYELSGRAAERVVGDELWVWGRLGSTVRRLRALEQKISVRFGEPLPLDRYQTFEVARLSDDLVRAYRSLTDLMVTHLAAAAVYELLAEAAGTEDVQRLLGRSDVFEAAAVPAAVARLLERVRAHPEHGRLDPDAARAGPEAIVEAAARAFAACHRVLPFQLEEGRVKVGDVGLLYFYRNRTRHLGAGLTSTGRTAAPPAARR